MKILILHASAGAGHRRAGEALAKAFKIEQPQSEAVVKDILDFTPALFRKSYATGYLDIVRKSPELWGFMYARSEKHLQSPWKRHIRTLFNKINTVNFMDYIREMDPDAIVCTHFMPLEILAGKKKRGHFEVPVFCIVTDFGVHALWEMQAVDRYYVANEEARRHLMRKGQKPEDVVVTGIPIDPVFADGMGKEEARKKLGLKQNLPTALILGGGFGVGPTVELVNSLKELEFRAQYMIVAGANEEMKKKLEVAVRGMNAEVKVYGFVNNIHEMMDAADIVISKPGGLTSSEVLAKGKPMVIIDPIPGQEQRNSEYMLEAGSAIRLYEVEDAAFKIGPILSNPARLKSMTENARRIGMPDAAKTICRDIVGKLK